MDEAKFSATPIRSHNLPGKLVARGELYNSTVFGSGIICKAGLIPVTGTEGQILILKYIRVVAQLAAQNGLQSCVDVKGEPPIPALRALVPNKGIHNFNPDSWSLPDVESKLGRIS